MNLNSVLLEGVVSGEPYLKKTYLIYALNFTVEYTRYYKNKAGEDVTEASLFDVVAFNNVCKKPLKDGMGVRLVGRLKQNTWTDKDGVSHSEVQIIAEHIEIKKAKEA